jgi:outer membrane receptor protein involved in Fe transport
MLKLFNSIRLIALLLIIVSSNKFLAQDTGNINGKITDQQNQPVAFANVLIIGTTIGAASDVEGNYTISNVPAGTHDLRASAVGYRAVVVSITVTAGGTLTQNFTLVADILNLEGVVVTGTITPRTKLESTVAISTLSAKEIEQASPRSTTEVLRYVPGFTRVESSGGEVNQNITMRGILGVEYVMFMENELPVFPTMHTFFMNADNLFRVDENVQTMEVIRGGNSALFGSNTPGAIVNIIDKTGGSELGGSIKVQGGTELFARYDFNVNGPLAEDWRFNLGGFYRYDQGVRDPGFPGIAGGQIKANITRLLDNGYVRASIKVLDDRNQFILPLPFQNPDDPDYVDGFSDYGSMNTLEGNRINVPLPNGDNLLLPLDNGLRTQAYWLTADISFDFQDGWNIKNTAQFMNNDQQWNAILPFNLLTVDDFIADRISALELPAGTTGQLFYTNHFDADGNKLSYNTSNGLVTPGGEWHIEKPISAFQNQFQVRKSIGKHNFSAGLYFANYTQTNKWYFTDILMDVRDNPRFLDLVLTAPGFGTINYTKNGFSRFLSNYVNGEGTTTVVSGVFGGELYLTDQLRADFGIRFEWNDFVQTAENTSRIDIDGDTLTTYDDYAWGNNTFRHFSRTIDDWAGSVGLNYKFTDEIAVFTQGSRAYKMPALDEFLNANAQAQIELFEARESRQVELGVKYSGITFASTLNGFWAEILNNIGQGLVVDPVTGESFWDVQINPDARAYGAELELALRPVPEFSILGVGTYINSETLEPGGSALTAGGVPEFIGNLVATFTSKAGLGLKADFHYVGNRDIIDAQYNSELQEYTRYNDVGDLKPYHYLNLGASYTFPNQSIVILADLLNVYQSKGLEEGNPRLIATGGNPIFLARPILPRRFLLGVRYQF